MCRIALYPSLEDWNNLIWELVESATAMGDGGWLKAVKLVQDAVDRGVGDEMVHVIVFSCLPLCFVDER